MLCSLSIHVRFYTWFMPCYVFSSLATACTCSSNLRSLSVGTKSGYKLFPLNSIERLEPSFEKGKDKLLLPSWSHLHILCEYCSGTALAFYWVHTCCTTNSHGSTHLITTLLYGKEIVCLCSHCRWRGGMHHWAAVCQQSCCHGGTGQSQEAEGLPLQGGTTHSLMPHKIDTTQVYHCRLAEGFFGQRISVHHTLVESGAICTLRPILSHMHSML